MTGQRRVRSRVIVMESSGCDPGTGEEEEGEEERRRVEVEKARREEGEGVEKLPGPIPGTGKEAGLDRFSSFSMPYPNCPGCSTITTPAF